MRNRKKERMQPDSIERRRLIHNPYHFLHLTSWLTFYFFFIFIRFALFHSRRFGMTYRYSNRKEKKKIVRNGKKECNRIQLKEEDQHKAKKKINTQFPYQSSSSSSWLALFYFHSLCIVMC